MKRIPIAAALSAVTLFMMFGLLRQVSAQDPHLDTPPTATIISPTLSSKIEPLLLRRLITETEAVPIIIYLHDKADWQLQARALSTNDPVAKRAVMVKALQETAHQSQAGVMSLLSSASARNQQTDPPRVRSLWIINAIATAETLETVLEIAARPEVSLIRLDKEIQLDVPLDYGPMINRRQAMEMEEAQWGVALVQANLVHETFKIDGAGIVVANVDTGVDWNHPSLQNNYRGFNGIGRPVVHAGNWFDPIDGATYPVDTNGHGTHTMGTIVGADGFGVAPGSSWIAVRAFNNQGAGLDSWLHAAYQWLLAPHDDPALAPHVVNNSWSNFDAASTEFVEDMAILAEAGILNIFSSGNNGPGSGSAGSPGTLPGVFSVGAIDADQAVTNFSGRGPTPWGEIEPEIVAPGKDVLSTLPGGTYGKDSGTSMAAPHVTGVAALLLQVAPELSQDLPQLVRVLTSTAQPLGASIPNYDSGWGMVDAYRAVSSLSAAGTLEGYITEGGVPIPQATVRLTARDLTTELVAQSNQFGYYQQVLPPNIYDVNVSAFGYVSTATHHLTIADNRTYQQSFSLKREAHGTLVGRVRAIGSSDPLAATISLKGTPMQTIATLPQGTYQLTVPQGRYSMTTTLNGYQVVWQTVEIQANQTTRAEVWLTPAPRILLVDSGLWQQESQLEYYVATLDSLGYAYDVWQIEAPFSTPSDAPTAEDLAPYEVVIWSSQYDSPSYVGASDALVEYLTAGGKLLLSGHEAAYYDGGGSLSGSARYFRDYLRLTYGGESSENMQVSGVGPFAGLTATLKGGDGADNQAAPDAIDTLDKRVTTPLLYYENGDVAGWFSGNCQPFRAIVLGFGLEGISTKVDRVAMLEQALTWLFTPPPTNGLIIDEPEKIVVGNFGDIVTHTVQIHNPGSLKQAYRLTFEAGAWGLTQTPPSQFEIPSCENHTITFTNRINTNRWHVSNTIRLTIESLSDLSITENITHISKSPAPLLLVDDDRFYSFAADYQETLETIGLPYDYWYVPKSWAGPLPNSPLTATLQMYPMVLWYTGYDWATPIATAEEARLAAYLEHGGRLFLSSQDYLYKLPGSRPSDFAQTYLGIQKHREDFTSTLVVADAAGPLGSDMGPYGLRFPPGYNNWTDGLTPVKSAQSATMGQAGQTNGITHNGQATNGEPWKTLFLSYGVELLTKPDRTEFMQRSLGWLSWLGSSTVTTNRTEAIYRDNLVYTAILKNDGWQALQTTHFTATLPPELTLTAFSPELKREGNNLTWSGSLGRNESRSFSYGAVIKPESPLGRTVQVENWFGYEAHAFEFNRIVEQRLNYPDLSRSTFTVQPQYDLAVGEVATYTIHLENNSRADVLNLTLHTILPMGLEVAQVDKPVAGTVITSTRGITWQIPIFAKEVIELHYRARVLPDADPVLPTLLEIDDTVSPINRTATVHLEPSRAYLPLIRRGD